MDPFTHAVAGAVVAVAVGAAGRERPARPQSAWYVPCAALVGMFPDVDVFLAGSPLEFLLLHRGITHALAAVPAQGLVLALICHLLWSRTGANWRVGVVWLWAMLLLLVHIWLDCVTTYGTMIFLPFSDYRVRLNGIFIIDFFLVLPLLWAYWRGRRRAAWSVFGVAWLVLYPACAVGVQMWHTHTSTGRLERLTQEQRVQLGAVQVLPDVFAPLFWRVQYTTDAPFTPPHEYASLPDTVQSDGEQGAAAADIFRPLPATHTLYQQGLTALGTPRTPARAYPLAAPEAIAACREQAFAARVFFDFCSLPTVQARGTLEAPRGRELRYFDLRFDTMLDSVAQLGARWGRSETPFQFWLRERAGAPREWLLLDGHHGAREAWAPFVASAPQAWWRPFVCQE